MADISPLRRLLLAQDGLLTRSQALSLGLSGAAIARRLRPGGPWRRLLPGVYAVTGGTTQRQRVTAGLLYLDRTAALTGPTALAAYGIGLWATGAGTVHLSMPGSAARDVGFLIVHPGGRAPRTVTVVGWPARPVDRAGIDACTYLIDAADRTAARAVVTAVRRDGRGSLPALCAAAELRSDGTAVRTLLAAVAGPDDPAAAIAARVGAAVLRAELPEPWWDVGLCAPVDRPIGRVLAWWPEAALAVRIGPPGREGPTGDRIGLRLRAAGVRVVPTTHATADLDLRLRTAHAAGMLTRGRVAIHAESGTRPRAESR